MKIGRSMASQPRRLCELGDGRSALNRDVGVECRQQSARQQDGTPAITLGQRRRKLDPALALCARIPNRNLGGEQEGCFFEPQSGRDQQIREQRVARAIAVTCSRALGSLDGQAAQSDVPKGLVVGEIDEADIGPAGSALVGFVATGNGSATPPYDLRQTCRWVNGVRSTKPFDSAHR
jgi:hypothetical protein